MEPLVFDLDLDRLNDRTATFLHLNGDGEQDPEQPLVILSLARDPWKTGVKRSARVRVTIEKLDA